MIQVRKGVFETNSSSTHCITICSEELYNKWRDGKAFLDRYGDRIVDASELTEEDTGPDENGVLARYITIEEFYNAINDESVEKVFTDSNNVNHVAIAYTIFQ